VPRVPLRRRRPGLLLQFGLLGFVLLVAVGALLANRLQRTAQQRNLDQAVHSAQLIATVGVQPLLQPADLQRNYLPVPDATEKLLDGAMRSTIADNGIVRLTVWNLQHWAVYSNNNALVGRWIPGMSGLDRAFAGHTAAQVADVGPAEDPERPASGRLLSVAVPLRVDPSGAFTANEAGTVIGAVEISLPDSTIEAAIAADTRQGYIVLGIGLTVVYLGLMGLVARASRRLRRQATSNAFHATHDELTGLANRRLLESQVDELLAAQKPGRHVALALLDLDRFKEINDTLGHHSGDEVLCVVAARLTEHLDAVCVARVGGDEFVVTASVADSHDALLMCDEIEKLLDEPVEVRGVSVSVRASIGLTVTPDHGADCDTLLQHADVAMYVAKRSGTTRQMYSPDFDHDIPARLGLATALRDALSAGQIALVYQPKLDIASCQVTGVEALVRWQHPDRGTIMPAKFMPIIENTELIGPLTWHVLDLALAQCADWQCIGIDLAVAVKLSARTLRDPSLVDNVRTALARHGLPGSKLELELAESALVGEQPRLREALSDLQTMGVRLAIDDFATGSASIGYLATLPVDVLKIDRSLVSMLLSDPRAVAIVRVTVDLARELGLRVVAEGVEDERTLAELLRLGCDHAQGYLIARPMPSEQMVGWMSRWYAVTRSIDLATRIEHELVSQ
jgi:diguanylate cyclase (GGDEF)-like protein